MAISRKNFALATLLLISSHQAFAAPTAEDVETCKTLSEFAAKMMDLRQAEADVVKLYGIAEGNPVILDMINSTWAQIPMMGDAAKKRQRDQWGNQYFLKCIQARG